MSDFHVLIVGGGIAGSVAAYWLGRAGAQVLILESASQIRDSGQGVDVRGKGTTVIRRMGVEEKIRSCTTKEVGMAWVDIHDQVWAQFDVGQDGSGAGGGFTSEIEIMRRDLAHICYDAAMSFSNVKIKFNSTISSLREDESGVHVDMNDGSTQRFDIVIGADGLGSKTRQLMLGPVESKKAIKSLDAYVSYFSLARTPEDSPRGRWCNLPGRKGILIRPKNETESSGYLTIIQASPELRAAYDSGDQTQQKQVMTKLFTNTGWESQRLLNEMQTSKDFYFQFIAQVQLDPSSWHRGRCVLVGDAASCPSPFSGMGTTVAILGAYILACEIGQQIKQMAHDSSSTKKVDYETAFQSYATRFGPYVKKAQYIPFGGNLPKLVNPDTSYGIWILRSILWLVHISGLIKVLGRFAEPPADKFDLPDYDI